MWILGSYNTQRHTGRYGCRIDRLRGQVSSIILQLPTTKLCETYMTTYRYVNDDWKAYEECG